MFSSEFFVRRGIFIVEDFLDADLCSRIRGEARATGHKPATVSSPDRDGYCDETCRRTLEADVGSETRALLRCRIQEIKPRLESYFRVSLEWVEEPQFLVYQQGSFFAAHYDSATDEAYPELLRQRQVSLVIFLNGEAAEPQADSYGGGALALYGLIDEPHWKECGFPIPSKPGLLIGFRSDLLHEVTPVTWGERYSIVSWYH